MAAPRESSLGFCTFGMFIIDEIDYGNTKGSESTIIGGAGLYAALGARLAAGHSNARSVSCIVDRGSDFPDEFQALIESWQTSALFRTDMNRLTTRAWNGYGPNQHRDFKYLTAKRRLEVESLTDEQALSSTFHMVCSPKRCMTLAKGLRHRRAALDSSASAPIIVWEPIPDLCTPAELANLREAATYVDVISPNGEELAAFFASGTEDLEQSEMVAALTSARQAVVVRDGADGSRLYLHGKTVHFRAYHSHSDNVIDPTGGGNTYLGALAMALGGTISPDAGEILKAVSRGELAGIDFPPRLIAAVVHATIAASYAIEQVGVPTLDRGITDSWNGETYTERCHAYLRREGSYLSSQIHGVAESNE